MIRLKKIEIAGFRGSLESLRIDLDASGRSMAIYGDNAAGKSSITDAVEWFYFNKVEHLWRENCKADALRNILLPEKDAATVELQFNEASLDCNKSISSELAISQSNKSSILTEYLAKIENGHERVTLRTVDIFYFILQGKTERRKELERIIGYEALDSFREIIGPTLYKLERTPEYITAKSNFQNYQKEILTIARINIFSDTELFEAGQRIAAEADVSVSIGDWAAYEAAGAGMRARLHNKDQGIKKAALSDCRKKCELLSQKAKDATNGLEAFSKAYAELIASEEQVRQIRLGEFLISGKKAIESQLAPLDTCPLCLQSSPWGKLREELETRIAKLMDSERKYKSAVTLKGGTLSMLDQASRASEDFVESAGKVDLEVQFLKPIEEFSSIVKGIVRKITDEFEGFKPISMNIERQTTAALDSATKASELLRGQEAALELSTEDQKLFDTVQRLDNLKTEFQRFQKTSGTKRKFELQIEALSEIGDSFAKVHREALQNALDVMSEDISTYYLAMHPKEEVDKIKLTVVEDGVEFEYGFHGKRVYPPLKYLSESHLNSLGIAAFLASAKIFNKNNNFFVLDDVITSFDSNHRLRLLRLLNDEFSGWQVIILTHERFWFEMIKKELQPSGWLVAEFETVTGAGIHLKKSAKSAKEEISEKKQNGTLTPNHLRTMFERILKEIGFALEVKVAFRYNDENERRMVGELLSELRSRLKKKSPGILSNPVFSRMEVCSLVTTAGSHDSGPILSPGDLDICCEDVLNFDGQFCCEKCGHYASVERSVPHDGRIYCKCGKKYLDWKE
jgi:recombinational DNA repair ATPase RecF